MKTSWYLEGDLQFSVFRKKGKQLKYFVMGSNHTPGNLCAIPSGVLNRLAKLTSLKPSLHYERVDKIYHDHITALFFYIYPQGDQQSKKYFNLSWLRVIISYRRFNNLAELLIRDLAKKIGRRILSKDLMGR